jgi:putative CocE/NonD family hydrolase
MRVPEKSEDVAVPDVIQRLTAPILRRLLADMPPATHRVKVRRNITVPMPDGVELLGDLYLPVDPPGTTAPTVLVRTPYGRGGTQSLFVARPLAERGLPVFVQSCRGTFGSGGVFTPQVHERSDGIATHRWVRDQPWFTGTLATTGASYLGYVQWAVAGELARVDPHNAPDAVCLQATMPDFGAVTWDNGAFALRNALGWTRGVERQERPGAFVWQLLPDRRLAQAFDHVPLDEADRLATGHTVHWYQDWLAHDDLADPYWTCQSHTESVADVTAPVSMVTGWYDIFLPWQLRTYAILVEAGRPPRLTVGPWGHLDNGMFATATADTYDFLRHHLMGTPTRRRCPVRVYVTGDESWRDYEMWPPAGVVEQEWNLQPDGGLARRLAPAGPPTRYVYDPADPTPSFGGPEIAPGCGPLDNTDHEKRSDVIVFTSDVLTRPIEVIGEPHAMIALRSDRHCTDLFVRLCDVHPDGRSMAVCDGIRRVGGRGTACVDPVVDSDGVRDVELTLWPTAHRFQAGHRLRIQVSSGAHPRYSRNPGGDEPLATARALLPARQEILHDPVRTSQVVLPVLPA